MGMFDSVWFVCPVCDNAVEVQSKAGDCFMQDFDASAVPIEIASDIGGEPAWCNKCDSHFHVVKDEPFPDVVRMKLK